MMAIFRIFGVTGPNRGEAFNQMRRCTFSENNGKLRTSNEWEEDVYMGCNQLMCLAIEYFNCYIMSEIQKEKESKGRFDEADKITKISPIAWSHINFGGKYFFGDLPSSDIAKNLTDIVKDEF